MCRDEQKVVLVTTLDNYIVDRQEDLKNHKEFEQEIKGVEASTSIAVPPEGQAVVARPLLRANSFCLTLLFAVIMMLSPPALLLPNLVPARLCLFAVRILEGVLPRPLAADEPDVAR